MSCLGIILSVSRLLVRNEAMYDNTGAVPVLNQLKPAKSDSWAIAYGALRGEGGLISNYALYHPTQGRQRPGLGRKVLFHGYAA